MIETMHFIRPEWLWAYIPVGLLIVLLWMTRDKESKWRSICDKHLLDQLLISSHKNNIFFPLGLLSLGWTVAILALAGPSFSKAYEPIYQKLISTMIVLDLSPAMNAEDVKPSRLARAKYKVKELLKNSKEGQIGLVVFTEEPYTVSPLTSDAKTIISMIPNITTEIMPTGGQKIGPALKFAAKIMHQAGIENGNLLLITPGPVSKNDKEIVLQLKEKGYRTSVMGIGSSEGAPVVEEAGKLVKDEKGSILFSQCDKCGLEELAKLGHGVYVDFTNSNADVDKLLQANLNQFAKLESSIDNPKSERWQDNGIWFVFILLPLTLIGFRRGWFS